MTKLAEHATLIVCLVVLGFVIFVAASVEHMDKQSDLSGQFYTSHGVTTERTIDESVPLFMARHAEVVDSAGK